MPQASSPFVFAPHLLSVLHSLLETPTFGEAAQIQRIKNSKNIHIKEFKEYSHHNENVHPHKNNIFWFAKSRSHNVRVFSSLLTTWAILRLIDFDRRLIDVTQRLSMS